MAQAWCRRFKRGLASWLLPAKSFVQPIEIFATAVGNDDHVLDANAAECLAVKTRFDGDDIACDEFRTTSSKERWFVDFQTQSMACSMGHAGEGIGSVLGW